jgi:hypothetical protein
MILLSHDAVLDVERCEPFSIRPIPVPRDARWR